MQSILNLEFECRDLNKTVSIRDYLKELLLTLWKEEEGFSGKRPFGNSGWQYEVYACLIKNGIIDGKFDSDGYIDRIDKKQAENKMIELIKYVFEGK